jgi:cytolysin-activating lysine-acyltransferase
LATFTNTCTNKSVLSHATKIGVATSLIMDTSNYRHAQIFTIRAGIEQAIFHEQIEFYYNLKGFPIGYVVWAYLTPDTERRLLNDRDFTLHPSEWNEGNALWVLDVCYPYGSSADIRRHIKTMLKSQSFHFSWVRRNTDNSIRKVVKYPTYHSQQI